MPPLGSIVELAGQRCNFAAFAIRTVSWTCDAASPPTDAKYLIMTHRCICNAWVNLLFSRQTPGQSTIVELGGNRIAAYEISSDLVSGHLA